jgi:hypothetical protein
MMPERDWTWLKTVKTRLHAAAPASRSTGPVITSLQLLDLGKRTRTGRSDQLACGCPLPGRLDARATRVCSDST